MTSKLRNAFLHDCRAKRYKTRCICLKLFKHRSEPFAKIEAYHPYRQSVVSVLSIFDDEVAMVTVYRYIYENYVYYGLKQGQVTQNIDNNHVLKLIQSSVQRLQIQCYFYTAYDIFFSLFADFY